MGELRCARSVCLPFVLSAARHCVRRHAGHVTERPRRGFPFARSAAAEVNYSCVQIGHAILRRHPITGAVQRGNSVTHSVADATLRRIAGSLKTERPVSFHGLLMCMREFAARRAKMDAILRKNHMADAAARAAPKSSNR